MKTVLQSKPPAACPLPKKKPTTRTQRALEITSDLLNRAVKGGTKPKKPVLPACSPTPTPKPTPNKPTKPSKPKPCTGKKCKREHSEHDLDNTFVKRAKKIIEMDDAKVYSWRPNDETETRYISVCSVLVVYNKNKVGMAHIPQAREIGIRFTPGEDVIRDLTSRLAAAFGSMSGATALFLHHYTLDDERVQQISDWARAQGATPKIETFEGTIPGSGIFNIRRFDDAWPPYYDLPL